MVNAELLTLTEVEPLIATSPIILPGSVPPVIALAFTRTFVMRYTRLAILDGARTGTPLNVTELPLTMPKYMLSYAALLYAAG